MSSDLFDEISNANNEAKASVGSKARIIAVLDGMKDDDRAAVLKALHDPSIQMKVIFNVLKKNGYDVSYDQIRRFRNGVIQIPPEYRAPLEGK